MFFEDHLIGNSDSEHDTPFPAQSNGGGGGGEAESTWEGTTPGSSQFPFPGRAPSAGTGSATAAAASSVSDVQWLIEATENERHCPDILPYPAAVVDTIVAHLAQQRTRIAQLARQEKETAARTQPISLLPFKPSDIMAVELQRIEFFLGELLRCRLKKIEAFCTLIHYEGQAEAYEQQQQQQQGTDKQGREFLPVQTPQRANLSANERVVADRLAMAKQRAVLQAGLQGAPEPLQHLEPHPPYGEGIEVLPEPDLDTYVFGVSLEDLGVVQVGEFAEQTIHAGEIFLMPYRTFRPYVLAGRVRLL